MDDERRPLLVLVGPTAVGKTSLALAWAEAIQGEIIAADSTTVYQGLDIGTAKPTPAEQARVRHHALNLCDPAEQFSVARFQAAALEAIHDIHARGRVPLLVGGTGLFVRSVTAGYQFAAVDDGGEWRARLEEWARRDGLHALRRKLQAVDPQSAEAILPGDERRVVRALEVFLATGQRIARARGPAPYRCLVVGLRRPRSVIRRRIWLRALDELHQGLLDEVMACLQRGIAWNAPGLMGLGYREGVAWARGRLAASELLPLIALHTAQFAKRQETWFRRERETRWIDLAEEDARNALPLVLRWTDAWLSGQTPADQFAP